MPQPRHGLTAAPVLLYGLFGLFVAATAYLIASSLTRRSVLTFTPSSVRSARTPRDARAVDTLTIDATQADRWIYVSLTRGVVLAPFDSTGWELAVQRYQIRTSGGVADLGTAPFDSVRSTAVGVRKHEHRSAPTTATFGHWYQYSWLTHLLEPRGHAFEVYAANEQSFVVQIISYYCPGPTAGCVTMRYAPRS